MYLDKSSLIADLGIDMMGCDPMFCNFMHIPSPYLEFYGEGFLILGFEHESEMEALISVELRNTDIVLVACDIESIGFAQLVHECIAELWIVLFDNHPKCENISNRADLHILFREDLAIDTEDTLASTRYERHIGKRREVSLQCSEKFVYHIALSIDIVDHLTVNISVYLAIEDRDRELIEDELVSVDIILLEKG